MRRQFLTISMVTCILGASPAALAQSVQERAAAIVSPKISAILREFPTGGPELRAAIASAIEDDPSLTNDAIFVANTANTSQSQAIRSGLADAADFFATISSNAALDAERRIRAALELGNLNAGAQTYMLLIPETAQGFPGFGNADRIPAGCVSPSRPGC